MLRTLLIALILVVPALADMTIRYTMELKPSPYMPPQAIEASKNALGDMFDKGIGLHVQGERRLLHEIRPTVTIFDPNTRMNTTLAPLIRRSTPSPSPARPICWRRCDGAVQEDDRQRLQSQL